MTYSVLICDDDYRLAAKCVEQVRKIAPKNYKIRDAPSTDKVRHAVNVLLRRRKTMHGDDPGEREKCLFDQNDILIIDYDLILVDDDRTQHTGEGIGRLARMYSDCAVVVVFNQYDQFDFDLSLRGHLESHADLNLTVELLEMPGLWTESPWQGFRPWSWQTLAKAVESQRARETTFRRNLDKSIVDTFGIEADDALGMSDSAVGFIAPKARDFDGLRAMTFRSFLSMTAASRDVESLLSSDESAAVRFGAARIGKWLDREVLGPQDVLIDMPHLLQRFPFLLGQEVGNVEAWNATIHKKDGLKQHIDNSYWFEPAICLSRPAVWVRRLEADPKFSEQRSDFDYSLVPDVVFMEDCSVFEDISRGTEFRAGFHNSFDRRYVKIIRDMRYGPQRRFAFGSD